MLQNREFQQDIDCIKSEMNYTMCKKLFLPHPLSLSNRKFLCNKKHASRETVQLAERKRGKEKLETDTILWQEEEHEEK